MKEEKQKLSAVFYHYSDVITGANHFHSLLFHSYIDSSPGTWKSALLL